MGDSGPGIPYHREVYCNLKLKINCLKCVPCFPQGYLEIEDLLVQVRIQDDCLMNVFQKNLS